MTNLTILISLIPLPMTYFMMYLTIKIAKRIRWDRLSSSKLRLGTLYHIRFIILESTIIGWLRIQSFSCKLGTKLSPFLLRPQSFIFTTILLASTVPKKPKLLTLSLLYSQLFLILIFNLLHIYHKLRDIHVIIYHYSLALKDQVLR